MNAPFNNRQDAKCARFFKNEKPEWGFASLALGFVKEIGVDGAIILFPLNRPAATFSPAGGEGRYEGAIRSLQTAAKHPWLAFYQAMSHLKATRLQLGLLINFNVPVLKNGINRVVYSEPTVMTPGVPRQ